MTLWQAQPQTRLFQPWPPLRRYPLTATVGQCPPGNERPHSARNGISSVPPRTPRPPGIFVRRPAARGAEQLDAMVVRFVEFAAPRPASRAQYKPPRSCGRTSWSTATGRPGGRLAFHADADREGVGLAGGDADLVQ